MIRFYPFSDFPSLSVAEMLAVAYEPLLASGIFNRKAMFAEWSGLDELAREESNCFFITRYGYEVAGFGSVDPRGKPVGAIGYHVVLPQFRGKGIGSAQLAEMEQRLALLGCSSCTAVTGGIEFFAPAKRLYWKNLYALVEVNPGVYFKTFRYMKQLPGAE